MRFSPPLLAPFVALQACSFGVSDLASFIDDDFGEISDKVLELEGQGLEDVLGTLMLRFRTYHFDLRDTLTIDELFGGSCVVDSEDSGAALAVTIDINCLKGDFTSPAEGVVRITQRQLAVEPVSVFVVEILYEDVMVGERTIKGREKVTVTQDPTGANITEVDFTLDGRAFSYTFRDGFIDAQTPVLDYEIPSPNGKVLARITNPTTSGGFVSVFLTGLDGTLSCEIRDAFWTPERPPRGTCENGVVFGLPE
jgi:hypothetical protein